MERELKRAPEGPSEVVRAARDLGIPTEEKSEEELKRQIADRVKSAGAEVVLASIEEGPIDGYRDVLRRSCGRAVAEFRGVVGPDCSYLRVTFEDEALARAALQKRAEEAARQFRLREAILVHRKGLLGPGETLTYAAAAADHREEALRALDNLLAGLKGLAKKEEG